MVKKEYYITYYYYTKKKNKKKLQHVSISVIAIIRSCEHLVMNSAAIPKAALSSNSVCGVCMMASF